jgi:ABC-type bacteriocin/lantibiotic exporter with double-glycine peptidase domain
MIRKWLIYRRLPWIRVTDPHDCGAAAFASIAGFYGHHLTLEQARILVSTDRDGSTLAGLRNGGRAIGLESKPAQAIYTALSHIRLPSLIHFEDQGGHYVVLSKWTEAAVTILDPNCGLRTFTRQLFESHWSGYLVEYEPTERLQPKPSDFSLFRSARMLIAPYRVQLLICLVLGLFATCVGWCFSFFLKALIDTVVPGAQSNLLLPLGAMLLFVGAVQAGLAVFRTRMTARIGRELHTRGGESFIKHLLSLPVRVFDSRCIASLVMRVFQFDTIQNAVSDTLVTLASEFLTLAIALGIIFHQNSVLALIAVGTIPAIALITLLLNQNVYDSQLALILHTDDLAGQMVGFLDGIRTIRAYSAESRYAETLLKKMRAVAQARHQTRLAMLAPTAAGMFLTSFVTAIMLWFGSSAVLSGHMSVGQLIVVFGLAAFYLSPAQRLPSLALGLRGAIVGLQRIEEILSLPSEASERSSGTSLDEAISTIEFKNVSFGYKPHRLVLRNLSFRVTTGQTIAIVGETGSGKSSIANLLAGFYPPRAGQILINDRDARSISLESFRQQVSGVFQGQTLFQQSVLDNVTMMAEQSNESVEEAAANARAQFIETLHRGYFTQVARGGGNFSAGQAQRIALARALLKNAPLLILDEATSALDGATEQHVLQALEKERRKRITVVISHRLSAVRDADIILVLHHGQIVEHGTHDQLLKQRSHYFRLFEQPGRQLPDDESGDHQPEAVFEVSNPSA